MASRHQSQSVTPDSMMRDDASVQRRTADYHSNLWDDDFIQILSTPYGVGNCFQLSNSFEFLLHHISPSLHWTNPISFCSSILLQAPSYRERADRLVEEVKELFNSISISSLNDLQQRLSMVDSVERLGIDRHFKNEIKSALDYVYRSVMVALLSSLFVSLSQV